MPDLAWRISIGFLALPIMCFHDILQTGSAMSGWTTSIRSLETASVTSNGVLETISRVMAGLADGPDDPAQRASPTVVR